MYPVYLEQGSNKNTGSRYGCNEIYYLRHTNISAVALVSLLSNSMDQIQRKQTACKTIQL